ncbi:MAG: hypothetical protein ACM3YM_06325, partial [Sphingomonadales bacterium]
MRGGAALLVRLLRNPLAAERIGPEAWSEVIAAARAETLLGSLASRLGGVPLPAKLGALLDDSRRDAERARVQALWEAEMAR